MEYPITSSPFKQEAPYGTRRVVDGVECVYMPDPWTFPEGYGNAWCSVPELIKSGIKPRELPMVKIAYNGCYGGFDLSTEGKVHYAKLLGYTDVKKVLDQVYVNGEYFSIHNMSRTDPYLIKTIEDLGDRANGSCARIALREVPKGTRYRIEEYDGLETVMIEGEDQWLIA